jgi:hypothetical protein
VAIDFPVHLLVGEGIAFDREVPEQVDRIIGLDCLRADGLQPGYGLPSSGQNDALPAGHFLQSGLRIFSELQKADRFHFYRLMLKINFKFNLAQLMRPVNKRELLY